MILKRQAKQQREEKKGVRAIGSMVSCFKINTIIMTNPQTEALHAFYNFKAHLLPAFMERNKRSLGSIEAELLRLRFEPGEQELTADQKQGLQTT
jgi:hypothetical protein